MLAPQSHFGERGMNAVANDSAISKPEFVDALWACLARPLGPKAIDDIPHKPSFPAESPWPSSEAIEAAPRKDSHKGARPQIHGQSTWP